MSGPMYGTVTPEMESTLEPHVRGKEVWDLGAGDLWHSKMLLRHGAARVVAVDKWGITSKAPVTGVRFVKEYFQFVEAPADGIDVAYLSWPINHGHIPGLVDLLKRSRVVVYVGSNLNGGACGNERLFTYLSSREVLGHIPHTRNTMAIYGGGLAGPRQLLPEEWAALSPDRIWTLDEATAQSAIGWQTLTNNPSASEITTSSGTSRGRRRKVATA